MYIAGNCLPALLCVRCYTCSLSPNLKGTGSLFVLHCCLHVAHVHRYLGSKCSCWYQGPTRDNCNTALPSIARNMLSLACSLPHCLTGVGFATPQLKHCRTSFDECRRGGSCYRYVPPITASHALGLNTSQFQLVALTRRCHYGQKRSSPHRRRITTKCIKSTCRV